MALGADRRQVQMLVLRHGAKLAALGIFLGAAGAVATTRVLASALYEIKPTDPTTFCGVALFLRSTALAGTRFAFLGFIVLLLHALLIDIERKAASAPRCLGSAALNRLPTKANSGDLPIHSHERHQHNKFGDLPRKEVNWGLWRRAYCGFSNFPRQEDLGICRTKP